MMENDTDYEDLEGSTPSYETDFISPSENFSENQVGSQLRVSNSHMNGSANQSTISTAESTQNQAEMNETFQLNQFSSSRYYSLLCLCYPYIKDGYSLLEISYILSIPYDQIYSMCYGLKNSIFLFDVYNDIPSYIHY